MSRPGGGAPAAGPRRAAVCRLCLSARDVAPIFASPERRVADRILACVHIQVDEDDGLPDLVCRRCLSNVDNWHAFKRLADLSQAKLRDWQRGDAHQEIKIKNEPASEEEDITIDASYAGPESMDGGRRMQPEGPPILASLGLAPRNEKESDEENSNRIGSGVSAAVAGLSEENEHRPIPVQKLASKDCLVCGRAYRYSHNARRHELNAHSYDRYTNKIEPGSPGPNLKTNTFKPKMRLMQNFNQSKSKSKYLINQKMRPKYNGEPEILKSLLTRSQEVTESENENDYSDPDTADIDDMSEPELASYPVEAVISVPDAYPDDSSDEENENEDSRSRSASGMHSDVMNINSQSDINRIIGIEEDEYDDTNKEVGAEAAKNDVGEDDGPPIAINVEVEIENSLHHHTSKPDDMPDDENKLDSDDGSCDDEEDDDDMHDPIVPIVEINENQDNDSELDDSDDEPFEHNEDADMQEKSTDIDSITITSAQKAFLVKYRDLIEQINTMHCKCCDRDFPRRKAVIQHLQKNGSKIPKHTCYTCVLPFTHIGALLSHRRYNCCNDTWKLIYKEGGIPDSMVVDENPSPDLQEGGTEDILKFPYKDVMNARSYACKLCPARYQLKQFIMKHILDSHESKAEQVPPLTCFNCHYKFGDHRLWRKHLRNCECTMVIECDICSETFINIQEFNEHAVMAHADEISSQVNESQPNSAESRPTDCPICEKSLSSYHNLIKHLKAVHNESQPHMCQYCEAKFKHYTDLSQHVYLDHSDTMVNGDYEMDSVKEEVAYNYSCTDCEAVFETVDAWTDHQISVHHHIAHECDQCEKKFWDEAELEEHRVSHFKKQLYKCTHCSNSFSSSSKLSEHMTQYHRLSSSMDRTVESQFYCEICIRSFKSRQAFSNHMRIHAKVPTTNRRSGEVKRPTLTPHPQPNRVSVKPSHTPYKFTRQPSNAPYSCDICGKGFLHKKNIWKHKKMLHPDVVNKSKDTVENNVTRNVSTEEEDYGNDDNSNRLSIPQFDSFVTAIYDQHENSSSHESALLYQCDLCDKRFAVKSSIWKHKRVKHGVMNPAPQDGNPETKKTENKVDIARPESTRISCTICKISFTDKKGYYRHRKVVHKANNLHNAQACTICGVTFNTSLELYEHLQSSHAKELLVTNAIHSKPVKKTPISRLRNLSDDEEMAGRMAPMKNHKDAKYSCEICGKGFGDVLNLQNHACIPRLPVSETYDCEICKKSYTSISALKSHRGWHLRSPDGRAAVTNSGLWMPQNKVTNKVSKHEVLENARPKSSSSPKEISPLLKRKLPPDVQVTLLKKKKTDEPKAEASGGTLGHAEVRKTSTVFCPICSKSFTRKSSLLVHMRKHDTSDIPEPPEFEDESDDDDDLEEGIPEVKPPIYRCEICNMEHNSSKALRRHRLKHHEVGGRETNFNQVLPKKQPDADIENRTIEEGIIKEYKCGLCQDEWDSEREVLSHPHYRCSHCGFYFSQEKNLNAHVRTRHSDSKGVYPCNECNRFYMNKKDLQRHVKKVH